ncbi:TetR/AcrR family transcriptional regulator [Streptomyces sp. NBC_00120]|uniref:TetR/AcrR family transcriptional regulator n=1 Tax=unclassified Streptomyces TaxID=2593676 RepID=UPI00225AE2F6|nr:TetR/AcrR family transcriptional regulator [Streptomyces sp. NBC_00120]MCX5323681.1 TetR/AcrR family transcriptional regulator [Streptomyces sp. NBC_00120]
MTITSGQLGEGAVGLMLREASVRVENEGSSLAVDAGTRGVQALSPEATMAAPHSKVGLMAEDDVAPSKRRLTPRGAVTRDRIVQAAADLFYVKGVNSVTLDDVRAVSGTSKSQLYRHFADKDELVHGVIELRAQQILERDRLHLERMSSFRALERWSESIIRLNSLKDGAYGCALGSLVGARAAQDSAARDLLAEKFGEWEELIAAGLRRMQENGELKKEADAAKLAVAVMSALQGSYLLAQMTRDVEPMRIAMDMALGHVKTYTVS